MRSCLCKFAVEGFESHGKHDSRCLAGLPEPLGYDTTTQAQIAAAVAAERERCAKEAERWLNRPRCKKTALDIAAAIRGGP